MEEISLKKFFIMFIMLMALACMQESVWADTEDVPDDQLQPRQMESLGRGVVAVNMGGARGDKVFVGWRMLGTDPNDIAFNLYRSRVEEEPVKLNDQPITQSTNYIDWTVDLSLSNSYFVRPVVDGNELEASEAFTLPANPPVEQYISINLETPPLRDLKSDKEQ